MPRARATVELGQDPATGLAVVARQGRFGPYVQLGTPDEVEGKPKTASLFQAMTPATITLDEALALLSLPRVLGEDAAGNEVTALNGRYGPYLKAGADTRSLPDEPSLFTVTLDEALALFAQPKTRGRRAAAAPLRELGDDPASGKPMTVRNGRFGPYVTDGETNASLRTGDDPSTITVARAAELLQDRRDRGPSTRPTKARGAKKSAKKATAKKATAKKATAKKAPAKKATAKKAAAKKARRRRRRAAKKATAAVRPADAVANVDATDRRATAVVTPRGRLIAFEGIDGSGKSTQARRVARARGALATFEPGDTELGASPARRRARPARSR